MREVYRCCVGAYKDWAGHTILNIKGPEANRQSIMMKTIEQCINIAFTIANGDSAYRKMAIKLYEYIGKSYVKKNYG